MQNKELVEFGQSLKIVALWGAWVAQSVEHLTLGFGSGHDLTVPEFEPHLGLSAVSEEPTSHPLLPSPSAPPLLALCLTLSFKNK